jgi:hypothetical protein
MLQPEIYIVDFENVDEIQRVGEALNRNHAIELYGRTYWPIRARYNKKKDVVLFMLDRAWHSGM